MGKLAMKKLGTPPLSGEPSADGGGGGASEEGAGAWRLALLVVLVVPVVFVVFVGAEGVPPPIGAGCALACLRVEPLGACGICACTWGAVGAGAGAVDVVSLVAVSLVAVSLVAVSVVSPASAVTGHTARARAPSRGASSRMSRERVTVQLPRR